MPSESTSDQPLEVLRRWEDSGAVWRVIDRTGDAVNIALLTCSAGEEVGRIHTRDPQALAFLGSRTSSEQPATATRPGDHCD